MKIKQTFRNLEAYKNNDTIKKYIMKRRLLKIYIIIIPI